MLDAPADMIANASVRRADVTVPFGTPYPVVPVVGHPALAVVVVQETRQQVVAPLHNMLWHTGKVESGSSGHAHCLRFL
jgi:hypothetical protein